MSYNNRSQAEVIPRCAPISFHSGNQNFWIIPEHIALYCNLNITPIFSENV